MRPPRPDEAPLVAELIGEYAPEQFEVVWVERSWTSPKFSLEADARIGDGSYAAVHEEEGSKAWIDLQGAVGRDMVAWAEERAREKGALRVFAGGWSGNETVKGAVEQAGYRLVRHSYWMRVDLDEAREEPAWPEGVAVRPFRAGDERAFYEVHQETFEDSWEHARDTFEEWSHWLLQPPVFEPELWFLAEAGDEPAGVAICHPRPGAPQLGWIGILGVRRPWRRRGLGRALLLHAFEEFRRRGFEQAGLGVDAESLTGAHRLYESVGMRVVQQFDLYEKHLS